MTPTKPLDKAREVASAAIGADQELARLGVTFRDVTIAENRPVVHWDFPTGISGSDGVDAELLADDFGQRAVEAVKRGLKRHPIPSTSTPPELTLAQWDDIRERRYGTVGGGTLVAPNVWEFLEREPGAAIAIGNAMRPEKDPRKITRGQLQVLRLLRRRANEHNIESWPNLLPLDRLIDTLDAILQPEDSELSKI